MQRQRGSGHDELGADPEQRAEHDDAVIPVLQEELQIGRRKRETGRVRIRKQVDVHDRVVEAPVRYEEVNVQRVPINAVVSPDAVPLAREDNGVLIIPVLEEVVVVQKVLMLKEELRVTRTERIGRSVQQVPLRSEHVEIERLPPHPGAPGATTKPDHHGEVQMNRTIVGVYDSAVRAQQVRQELLNRGFDEDEVQVSGSTGAMDTEESSRVRSGEDEGGIMGFFRSLFGNDDEDRYSTRYSAVVQGGKAVVTVDADSDDEIEEAQRVMNRYEPLDIDADDASVSSQAQDWVGDQDRVETSGAAATASASQSQRQQSVPIVQEELHVGKRAVVRGGVRVFTRVEERPVEETVRLREERATVERTPADRTATEGELQALRDGVIEVRETAEEPVVAKRARVVEEVRVGKQVEERTETVRDTVRHTEVEVQSLSPEDHDDFRRHWQAAYGSAGGRWEDYEPAYRYGSSLAADERYRDSDWDTIEPNARRDWEARSPGTWERMKDSVRHAWTRARS
jgi:uncharacterized protein (TIGR02271 family)